jgi:hypothetical protein
MDILGRDSEQPGDASLGHGEALARRVDRQPVAVPCSHDRVRLHRIVVLRRCLVGRVDARACRGEARLDIAAMHLGWHADADKGRNEALSVVEADPGWLGVVAGGQKRGAFGRGLERCGDDDGDRLVCVAHVVVLQNVDPEHEGV